MSDSLSKAIIQFAAKWGDPDRTALVAICNRLDRLIGARSGCD